MGLQILTPGLVGIPNPFRIQNGFRSVIDSGIAESGPNPPPIKDTNNYQVVTYPKLVKGDQSF